MASCDVRSDSVVYVGKSEPRAHLDLHVEMNYLGRFQFTLLRTELAAPRGLCIRELFHTALEFVQLPPPLVQRLAYLVQLLGVPSLCFLSTLLEIELDLAHRFQSADEIVVEDSEICVWLCLRLTAFLL
jgi:hypothetical protein